MLVTSVTRSISQTCARGAIKQNDFTVRYYVSKAEKVIEITEITPVIYSNCTWDEAILTKEAAEEGILVLTQDEIVKLNELALDSRPHNEVIELLNQMGFDQEPRNGNSLRRYTM
jgi:hypothetical protein